jgi:hypothetical protein
MRRQKKIRRHSFEIRILNLLLMYAHVGAKSRKCRVSLLNVLIIAYMNRKINKFLIFERRGIVVLFVYFLLNVIMIIKLLAINKLL